MFARNPQNPEEQPKEITGVTYVFDQSLSAEEQGALRGLLFDSLQAENPTGEIEIGDIHTKKDSTGLTVHSVAFESPVNAAQTMDALKSKPATLLSSFLRKIGLGFIADRLLLRSARLRGKEDNK